MNYSSVHLNEAIEIIKRIENKKIEQIVRALLETRNNGGRLFFLGVGGSAGNCSHAVNDFRKIVGIESYAPTDNVSELTARTNDEGWDSIFSEWLVTSKLNKNDCIFIFSVGGGNKEKNISTNLISAINYAKEKEAKIVGVVGRDGGYAAKSSNLVLIVPVVNNDTVTPHTEAFQAVIWHLIVSHPLLKINQTNGKVFRKKQSHIS